MTGGQPPRGLTAVLHHRNHTTAFPRTLAPKKVHFPLDSVMTHITVYSALVLLALTLCSHAQTLGKIDCHAVNIMGIDGNSHVFDFTALQDSTSTPIIVNDSRTSDTYQLSMFNNFNCNGNPAAVCQQSSNGSSPCGVGFATFTVADWIPIDTLYPYGAVRFRLNPTGIPARYSTITIVCDMIATTYVFFLCYSFI